jgi:hypothetical protein
MFKAAVSAEARRGRFKEQQRAKDGALARGATDEMKDDRERNRQGTEEE